MINLEDYPIDGTVKAPISALEFDFDNPRFAPGHAPGESSREEIVIALATDADLDELIQSISQNGYIDIEPLIVLASDSDTDHLTVLEGNRRLAALLSLRDPDFAAGCGIAIPDFIEAGVLSPDLGISVYRVAERVDARSFIGFKHINGAHRWDAISKAKFAAEWYSSSLGTNDPISLADISRKLGDSHDTVRRLVNGYFVLEQAKAAGIFKVEDRLPKRAFGISHLYTALTRTDFQKFLDLPSNWMSDEPSTEPIPKRKLDRLKEVLVWLYGSAEAERRKIIQSQNPDIRRLGNVLDNPVSLAILRETNDLNIAEAELQAPEDRFESALLEARRMTKEALSNISGYSGDVSFLKPAEELVSDSKRLFRDMKTEAAQHADLDEDGEGD